MSERYIPRGTIYCHRSLGGVFFTRLQLADTRAKLAEFLQRR